MRATRICKWSSPIWFRFSEKLRSKSRWRRDQLSEIPWKRIIGMRHRIVHDYMNVDAEILWEVVRRNVPELVAMLENVVPPEKA